MNSEDIYSSLRGVTEAIQNFSFRSQEDMNEPLKRDSKKDGGDSVSILISLLCRLFHCSLSIILITFCFLSFSNMLFYGSVTLQVFTEYLPHTRHCLKH